MDKRIATIHGTMLTPGVSRNKRLYSRELIAKAAARMTERIADPDGLPIVMRSHHEAGDDSTRIVGRLTDVRVGEDGAARYRADLYDTAAGRDIAALVTGKDPALKSVSIHGYWLGPVKRVQYEGETVATGSDLEIDALDFTATPGVPGASVAVASYLDGRAPAESVDGRTAISESVEVTLEPVTEEDPGEAYSAKQKRDALAKGQAMKNASGDPSYPIKSKSDLRKAIKAVGRGGADHDKIRAHIVARAKALGLTSMIPDTWNKDGSMKETTTRLGEIREYYPDGPGGGAGFCIDAYNGPISLTMRACGIEPAELRTITAAAMTVAVDALQAMDPDMDADIDVPGAPNADTDGDMGSGESAPPAAGQPLAREHVAALEAAADAGLLTPGQVITSAVVTEALALTETAPPTQGAATTHTEEEAAMGEPTPTDETTAAPARSLTDADITALGALFGTALKEAMAPVTAALAENTPKADKNTEAKESAPAAPKPANRAKESKKARKAALAETVAELQATFDTKLTEALAKQRDELRETLLKEHGLPERKGYRVHENDKAGPASEDDADALFADRANTLLGNYGLMQPAQ
ncbi:hypothetical protein [Streptomyces sp. CBMA152]|uniref:hypothetical protein n=1 Tax=Streptomyces sp. CBMA152 TaxID=1896312 RepID=UPI00166119F6|nr:hypothetical protein [Streptomyces sp. CBMA152]MBD0743593.1 hypothetical protein [Streptomyces sp. CBMA152]